MSRLLCILSIVICSTVITTQPNFAEYTTSELNNAKQQPAKLDSSSEISSYRPKQHEYSEHDFANAKQFQWSNRQMTNYERYPDMVASGNGEALEIDASRKDSDIADNNRPARESRQKLRSLFEMISSDDSRSSGGPSEENDDQMSEDEALYFNGRSQLEENLRNYQQQNPKMEKFLTSQTYPERYSRYEQQQQQRQQHQLEQQASFRKNSGAELAKDNHSSKDETRSVSDRKNLKDADQINEKSMDDHSASYDSSYLQDRDRGRLFVQSSQLQTTSEGQNVDQVESISPQPVVGNNDTSSVNSENGAISQTVADESMRDVQKQSISDFFGNRKPTDGISRTDLAIEYLKNVLKNRQSLLREATAKLNLSSQREQFGPLRVDPVAKLNSTNIQVGEQVLPATNYTTALNPSMQIVKETGSPSYKDKFSASDASKEKVVSSSPIQEPNDSYEKQLMQQNRDEYRRKVIANNQFVPMIPTSADEKFTQQQQVMKSNAFVQSINVIEPVYQYPNALDNSTQQQVLERPSPPPVNFTPFEGQNRDNQSKIMNKESMEKLHQLAGFSPLSHGSPVGGDYVESLDDAPRGLRSIMQRTQESLAKNKSDFDNYDTTSQQQQQQQQNDKPEIHSLKDILFTSTEPGSSSRIPIPKSYKNEAQTFVRMNETPPISQQSHVGHALKSNENSHLEQMVAKMQNIYMGDKYTQSNETAAKIFDDSAKTKQQDAIEMRLPQEMVATIAKADNSSLGESSIVRGESMEPKETKLNLNYFEPAPTKSEADIYGPDIKISNTLYGLHGAEQSLTSQEVEAIRQQLFIQQHQPNEYSADNLPNIALNLPANFPYSIDDLNQSLNAQLDNEFVPTPNEYTSGVEKKEYSTEAPAENNYPNQPRLQFMQTKYVRPNLSQNSDAKQTSYPKQNTYPGSSDRPNLSQQNALPNMFTHHHQDFTPVKGTYNNNQNKQFNVDYFPTSIKPEHVTPNRGAYSRQHELRLALNNGQQHSKGMYQDKNLFGQLNQDEMRVMDSFMSGSVRSENTLPPIDISAMDLVSQPQLLMEAAMSGSSSSRETTENPISKDIQPFISSSTLSAHTDLQRALEQDFEKSTSTKQNKHSVNGAFGKAKKNDTTLSLKKNQHHQYGSSVAGINDDDSKKKSLIVYLNHPRLNDVVAPSSATTLGNKQSNTNTDGYSLAQTIGVDEMPDLTKLEPGSDFFGSGSGGLNKTDTDGLSVVVVGDAHKYKKIVLLISSKSGGLKFLPMVKEMP